MVTLIKNIKSLINVREEDVLVRGKELSILPQVNNSFLLIEDGFITDFGSMNDIDNRINNQPLHIIDAKDQFVLPAWCDSHTHIVFAGSRENEFVDKIKGKSYAEIAANGGGILNSAKKVQDASEDFLFNESWKRLNELSKLGTGSIEIKSGYGLTVEAELKMLRVIKKLKEKSNLNIKATFLGAHTFPVDYIDNHEAYIDLIINEMLPVIANEKLADYIDVFCESGFYNVEEMERICNAGMQYNLKPKLHINQLNSIGGIQSAIKMNAISVDHLETMTSDDVKHLSASNTIGTLLPTAAFFLGMPYQPARQLIDSNCTIALASDYNPGSTPSGNMNFVVALSCIQMKMLPEEAINAATINGAFAMESQFLTGSIKRGKRADLIITKPIPSLAYLPYSFGSNLIDQVIIKGDFIN
jgi:imidazolonepropionase